jgi:23S rRNA (cytosine1962-C5)-methyltransferase
MQNQPTEAATPSLKLNHPNRPRSTRGHPWVFTNELREPPSPALDGGTATLRSAEGRIIGSGIVNSRSQIVWRRYSRDVVPFDAAFIRDALARAIARRREEPARRLVWSESDCLPGLVVDQYGDCLSVQAMTLAMEKHLPQVIEALQSLLSPREIVLRHDAPVRRLEGLPLEVRTVSGRTLEPFWLKIGRLEQWIDLPGGQKTGLYLDQREEHVAVAELAKDRRVLDACCNAGGFGLHAALAGAREVIGIDSAPEALALARKNAERNGLTSLCSWVEANIFDYFTDLPESELFDMIVLDPPPFARSHKALDGALRGYKELNLRAIRHLNPGGILATYACSHHITHDSLLDIIGSAAHDARRSVRVLRHAHQPADHPVMPGMPESEYLRGFVLEVS